MATNTDTCPACGEAKSLSHDMRCAGFDAPDQSRTTALRRLEIEMREAEKAYRAAKERYEQAIKDSNPIKPGDVIRSAKGTLAKVVAIGVRWDEPKIHAVLQKKDGTFGKREATMWRSEWDKPEVVA